MGSSSEGSRTALLPAVDQGCNCQGSGLLEGLCVKGERGTGGRGLRDEDLCERTGTAGAMRVRLAQTAFFFQGGEMKSPKPKH